MTVEARSDIRLPAIVKGIPLAEEPGLGALSIPGYLAEVVDRYADREALVMHAPDGAQRWSYADLQQRAEAVARALVACGVGRDTRVGILMSNRPEYLAALFGIAMAGGVSVALSTFSTAPELEHQLRASAVAVLLFEARVLKQDFTATLCELDGDIAAAGIGQLRSGRFPYLQRLVQLPVVTDAGDCPPAVGAMESWESFLARGATVLADIVRQRARQVAAADAGGLFFSSGTTSLPKGILHAQRAFTIQWWRWPRVLCMREPVRAWTGNGFFWSANVTMMIGTALSTGGSVVLQPLFEPEASLRLIQQERVTFLLGRPHQWARLQALPAWQEADLGSLRYVTKGELVMSHPTVHTDWQLPNSFGTTETMTIMTSFDSDTSAERYAGSFGAPLPGNVLKIVDPLTGALLDRDQRGEICVKGPTLMTGYLGKAVEDTFDADGYYCTGDGGYVDAEGRLYWEGRLNDIIKTGGANVSPEEVDAVIASCPGVKRTQTVGVAHDTLGEMVVACIVLIEGADIDESDIIAYLGSRLARYKIPRRVLFFREEEFAMTGNEKARAGEIRDRAAARLAG